MRELAPDPLNVTEETPSATMKIVIAATRKRLGVTHRPWNMRKPARAPLAPDIASNAHPAHTAGRVPAPNHRATLPGPLLGASLKVAHEVANRRSPTSRVFLAGALASMSGAAMTSAGSRTVVRRREQGSVPRSPRHRFLPVSWKPRRDESSAAGPRCKRGHRHKPRPGKSSLGPVRAAGGRPYGWPIIACVTAEATDCE